MWAWPIEHEHISHSDQGHQAENTNINISTLVGLLASPALLIPVQDQVQECEGFPPVYEFHRTTSSLHINHEADFAVIMSKRATETSLWEAHKGQIVHLYYIEKKSLSEVMAEMAAIGFVRTYVISMGLFIRISNAMPEKPNMREDSDHGV